MELDLCPVFYNQVGTTLSNCMKLLPTSGKNPQKIAIGDEDGTLTCFGIRRGDVQLVFKTLPSTAPISCVQLNCSTPGSIQDKIFTSVGAEVRAYTKKGKQFLTFDSNLTEPIRSMWVEGSHLLTAGSYVYNHYVDCNDSDYYLCSDVINSVLCLPTASRNSLVPVLGCQDCSLRVLKGSELLYELEVAGAPTTIALNEGNDDGILYGTQDGCLGLVKIHDDSPEYCWDMINEHNYGSIQTISVYDVTSNGVPDILLGHSDGIVQVYSLDENYQPRIQFTHAFNESVTSICGGHVTSTTSPELVISTYSGIVHGLVEQSHSKRRADISPEVKAKLEALKVEIEQLESQVDIAAHKHYQAKQTVDKTVLSAIPYVPINHHFTLNHTEAWYTLVIETQVPLDTVLLQSDVPIDLQEVDKSTAVISYTPPDTNNSNYLLATFRCSGSTSRLEVKLRSIEGQYGTLNVYVTPQLEPRFARLLTYDIKPLSLHRRVHTFDSTVPVNVLRIEGKFGISDIHSWIGYCLFDVPDKLPDGESMSLQFKSSFVNTQLECVYKQNEAEFKSDNLSTLSVIKEVISKEATKKNISIKLTHDINAESINHMLHLLYPMLEEQILLAKNVQLIEALEELKIHENDVSFLSPQCQFILDNASRLQDELKRQPAMIDRLYALITDLFMDRASFKGSNVKHRVPQLLSLLDNCTIESLIQFFNENI